MNNQLDISIKSVEKYLTNRSKIEDFFTKEVTITQKTDGVKLTVLKVNNNGNLNDYIFSYKGNILYPGEFNYLTTEEIAKYSIGASQFQFVFNHFRSLGKNEIPINTELFIEFLMNKPTLMSNYSTPHKMVLIAHSPCKYDMSFGKLNTISTFQEEKVQNYADELKLDTPRLLFKGVLNNFKEGIKDKELLKNYSESLDLTKIENIKQLFLSVHSYYGGQEEGVVLSYDNIKLKFVQDYQHSKEERLKVKMKYKEDDFEEESKYWESINNTVQELIKDIPVSDLSESLCILSEKIKQTYFKIHHTKKSLINIKDDIQLTSKLKLIKQLPGNNNALVLGKFRVLTNGHIKMIQQAISNYDNVVICIVTSKDTKRTKELRYNMVRTAFPDLNIIHSESGNLIRIIQKSPININAIVAGTDRVPTYSKQLEKSDIKIEEVRRDDISATDVINHMFNYEYFLKSTPIKIHNLYGVLKETYE